MTSFNRDADRSPLRADARRNRNRILDTAASHFASHGIGTSLDDIAKAAGVGAGTLYRHFPTREALLAAILEGREGQLLAGAQEARNTADPDEALRQWLDALQDFLRTFGGLPESVLVAVKENASPLAISREKLIAITGEFLGRAQEQGCAHTSVTANDLFLGALAFAWVLDRVDVYGTTRQALRELLANGYRMNGQKHRTHGDVHSKEALSPSS